MGSSPVTIATYTDDLVAILEHVGVQRAVVCGLSMGGYIAFDLVRRYPERVRGLVLMDTRAEADTAEERRRRDRLVADVHDRGHEPLVERLVPRLLSPVTMETRPEVVEELVTMVRSVSVDGVVAALHAMRDRGAATDILAGLDIPTLVMAGENDQITPPTVARGLAANMPRARHEIVLRAGHVPPLEEPEATTNLLAAFLESLGT